MSALPEITPAEWVSVDDLKPNPLNTRVHSDQQLDEIGQSLQRVGWARPLLADEDGVLIYGHGTLEAAKRVGYTQALVSRTVNRTEDQKRFYMIADNATALLAAWDEQKLAEEIRGLSQAGFNLAGVGLSQKELDAILNPVAEDDSKQGVAGSLSARFGVPPFTVLNAREGWWQDRKAAWIGLGIRSEVGRTTELPEDRAAKQRTAPKGGGGLWQGKTKSGKTDAGISYGKPKRTKSGTRT